MIEISGVHRGLGFWVCALRCASRVKSDVLEVCTLRGGRCAVQEWIEDAESFPKHPGSPSDSSNSASCDQNGASREATLGAVYLIARVMQIQAPGSPQTIFNFKLCIFAFNRFLEICTFL